MISVAIRERRAPRVPEVRIAPASSVEVEVFTRESDENVVVASSAGVVPVKKGYRAGKPDTPSTEPEDGAQQSLEGAAGGEEPAAGSPEAAFIASSLDDKVKVTREPEPTGKVHTLRKKA